MCYSERIPLVLFLALLATGCASGGAPAEEPAPRPEAPILVEPEREPETKPQEEASSAVLGAVVSQSGSPYLERYGALVLEGIRLAVERHNASGGRPVELVVLDDAGDPARAAQLVAQLEQQGAVGIVGPLLPPAVAAAARARSDTLLAIVSPTAPDEARLANVYTLNTGDTRGAEALAAYAVRSGLGSVGLLYPSSPEYRRQARAFRQALVAAGGSVVADVPYEPGTTTFAAAFQTLVEAQPQAVFIPAPERDVRQVAPQVVYYGLQGVQVLGGEAWTSEEVLRQVAARYLEGVVAATPLYRPSRELGWRDFVALYESAYRQSLANPIPALGYDAATLLLTALGGDREGMARRLAGTAELRGATGVFTIREGSVERRPFLVRIAQGELVPIAPESTLFRSPFPGGPRNR